MLTRKVEKKINNWINHSNSHQALLVYGARQVGKTFIIRKCLNDFDYVEFNLIQQNELAKLLAKITSRDELITILSLFTNKQINENTIIFFDEIQECKNFITKIKFLVEERKNKYILSGSLLGVEINQLQSAPVGYLESLTMYPLDFEEFLQVFHINKKLMNSLQKAFNDKTPVLEEVNNKLLDIFNLYTIVGGMPQAVMSYLNTKSLEDVVHVHQQIIEQYKLDFTKYEDDNKKLMITDTYELIPAELNEKNKRYNISKLKKRINYDRVSENFIWLKKAGVAIPVYNVTEPTFPLMLNEKSSLFKLFLSDVGLLTTLYGTETKIKILTNETSINHGAIYENVVVQELNSHGFKGYYFNSKKQGEIDFVIENGEEIVLIEVKSGKDFHIHSALNHLLDNANYPIHQGLVFANTNVFQKNKVTYYPIYMIMFLNKTETKDIRLPEYDLSFQ